MRRIILFFASTVQSYWIIPVRFANKLCLARQARHAIHTAATCKGRRNNNVLCRNKFMVISGIVTTFAFIYYTTISAYCDNDIIIVNFSKWIGQGVFLLLLSAPVFDKWNCWSWGMYLQYLLSRLQLIAQTILTSVRKANEIVAEEIEGDSVCRPTSTLTDKDSCPVVVGLNWTGLDQPQHSWPHHLSRSSYSLRLIVVPATCRFSPSLVSLSSSCILQGVDGGMFIKLLHVWLAIVSSLP